MLLTLAILLTAQPVNALPTTPVFLSKELGISALSQIDAALTRPLDDAWEVNVGGGGTRHVKTCLDFLAVTKGAFELQEAADWAAWQSQGAPCFALDALRAAKPASRSNLGWFRFSKPAIAKLPAGLAMLESPEAEDEARAAAKACRGLGKFDASLKVHVKAADRAALATDEWNGSLILYARADLDGDGWEDLLLGRDAHLNEGTATSTEVFVVSQSSPNGCARVARTLGGPESRR